MISTYLSSIDGVAIYPIFSLLIFLPFFVFVTISVLKMDKSYTQKMASLPLDNSNEDSETK